MNLETITELYGMEDYLDMVTGYIYELSKAIDNGDGTLKIPVKDYGTKNLIGYATMNKAN